MNIEKIKSIFDNYVNKYDMNFPAINLKYDHSYRVMNICKQIAEDINLSEDDINLSMIIGLLHDYARFEQWTIYKSFRDATTVDHGDLAVQKLFDNNEIEMFDIPKENYDVIRDAIKYHNKYSYPDNLSDRSKLFCKIVRDADKLDIFYLISVGDIKIINDNSDITQILIDEFYENKHLKLQYRKTKSDVVLFYLAIIYDLNFKFSYQYLKDNDFINKLFDFLDHNQKFEQYFNHINKYIEEGSKEYVRKKI